MPHALRPRPRCPAESKRPAHRPTKFTPELGEKICELIACGWLMKDAAGHLGIPAETVCRWVVKHETFRETYAVARGQRTEIWAEEIIEIADDAARDYTTDKHGHFIFDSENVHRARLQIELRKWQMARLDPRLWGDRQQIDVRNDWHLLTEQERRRKAEEIIAMIRELREPPPEPPPLVYRPEQGLDTDDNQGGIGS